MTCDVFARMSTRMSTHMSTRMSMRMSTHMSTRMSTHMSHTHAHARGAHDAYIRLMSSLYRSWMSFRFILKAAVTSPMSGDHTSVTSFTASGTSNFSKPP
ncbi:unnamed protein product [Arctia plantaginis]|uniref:Uncharacterized protein n=1 Tax=Arctia plantaginis TaxID=874455 RepID=A0A8S0ZSM1_ARCPL|nr:unnamed protein product [Arctia plantaginis]